MKSKSRRSLPLERVIYGLGIRLVGERTAQFLAEHFGSMDALMNAGEEELQEVNEVGPRIAESIVEFFQEPKNRALVKQLAGSGLALDRGKENNAAPNWPARLSCSPERCPISPATKPRR